MAWPTPSAKGDYRRLEAARIIETLESLRNRIGERFPNAGLHGVSTELLGLANRAVSCAESLGRPNYAVRISMGALILMVFVVIARTLLDVGFETNIESFRDLIVVLEAGINDVIFLAVGVFFLVTLEARLKRRKALREIHGLRSIAHIVDMHQLTKDPEALLEDAAPTPSSPKRTMTRYELSRYLDYCSEMLSITSKIAALYVQNFSDPVVLGAVNEVETLTTGLSRKIWQKIMILSSPLHGDRGAAAASRHEGVLEDSRDSGETVDAAATLRLEEAGVGRT